MADCPACEAVRAVHQPLAAMNVQSGREMRVCTGCGSDDGNWNPWPCPTLRAMERAAVPC